ncbi:hypothetical protein ACFLZ5_10035 [Thermodesulfobacteriota bacterium]
MLKFSQNLFSGVMGAAPCWVLVVLFVMTWQTPMAVDEGRWVKLGVGIMLLEFILVHSGGFFAAFSQKKDKAGRPIRLSHRVGFMLGLLCFYTIFAVCFSLEFNSWTLFWIFCWVTVSRFLAMFFDAEDGAHIMMQRSGVSALLYISSAFLSIFIRLPRAGLTEEVLNKIYPGRGGGEWERDPQQALLAGMVYFGFLGLWELLAPFLAHRKNLQNQTQEDTR